MYELRWFFPGPLWPDTPHNNHASNLCVHLLDQTLLLRVDTQYYVESISSDVVYIAGDPNPETHLWCIYMLPTKLIHVYSYSWLLIIEPTFNKTMHYKMTNLCNLFAKNGDSFAHTHAVYRNCFGKEGSTCLST